MVEKRFVVTHSNPDAARLERLRQKLELSRKNFADLLGMSLRTYERFVTAKSPIAPSATVMLLAQHLERSPEIHAEIVAKYRKTHPSK
jgi:DNA-binding transcriptional regulator YiaG